MDLINDSSSSDSDDQKSSKFKLPLNPIQGQEKITGHQPTKPHHRLITENLHDESKIIAQIYQSNGIGFSKLKSVHSPNHQLDPDIGYSGHNLFLKTSFEHKAIINFLCEQQSLCTPNHQFDTENGYYVCLFGPRTFTGDDSFEKQVQITRHEHQFIKKFMDDPKFRPSPNHQFNSENGKSVHTVGPRKSSTQSQGHETFTGKGNEACKNTPQNQTRVSMGSGFSLCHNKITGSCHVASPDDETITVNQHDATKIAPRPNQVCEKIHDATKIDPPNQVCEMITGNCKRRKRYWYFWPHQAHMI